MAVFNEPSKWQTSLVNSGDANTIPQSTPAGTGEASFEDGFPQITQVPIGAGGIAPDRKDFNGLFKILGDWIFFAQNGGLPTYSADFDYVAGRVVLYNGNLYKCIQANGASSTVVAPDSDDTYWQQLDGENTSTSLIPNQIITSPVPLTDANLHLLDGALLSGSGAYSAYVAMMADLYNADPTATCWTDETSWQASVTTYGECGKFVYDSVNNTLRLPKLKSFIQATTTASELGTLVEAGAPNITGFFKTQANNAQASVVVATGAFSATRSTTNTYGQLAPSNGFTSDDFTFNASQSNSIYGNSSTIQPQSIKYYFYIVVGTVSKTDIQIDIDNVMSDLALKADKDLSNTTPTSAFATAMNSANIRTVVETYVNGASWYRVYSDGFCIQGGHNTVNTNNTITLLKPFADTDYIVNATTDQTLGTSVLAPVISTKTVNNFILVQNQSQYACYWTAYGYVS